MDSYNEYNIIEINNAEQLRSKDYHMLNNHGSYENRVDIQGVKVEQNKDIVAKKSEKKQKSISNLLTTFVATLSTIVIGATSIPGIMKQSTSLVAMFEDTYATAHEIYYNVVIQDTSIMEQRQDVEYSIEDMDLKIILHNDFTNRQEKIEEFYIDGCFENLKDNMVYVLEVKLGDIVIGSKTMRTTTQRPNADDSNDKQNQWQNNDDINPTN